MKKTLLSLAALALLMTSCTPDAERAKIKKDFAESCLSSAQQSFRNSGSQASKEIDQLLKDYCECSGEKVVSGLKDEEIKEIEKDKNAISQSRLLELAQPCTDEFNRKMQALSPKP